VSCSSSCTAPDEQKPSAAATVILAQDLNHKSGLIDHLDRGTQGAMEARHLNGTTRSRSSRGRAEKHHVSMRPSMASKYPPTSMARTLPFSSRNTLQYGGTRQGWTMVNCKKPPGWSTREVFGSDTHTLRRCLDEKRAEPFQARPLISRSWSNYFLILTFLARLADP
jgi:hypothetical protein